MKPPGVGVGDSLVVKLPADFGMGDKCSNIILREARPEPPPGWRTAPVVLLTASAAAAAVKQWALITARKEAREVVLARCASWASYRAGLVAQSKRDAAAVPLEAKVAERLQQVLHELLAQLGKDIEPALRIVRRR